jgi:aminomethyltransferase
MPVEYTGISDEHLAVRTRAGLFDVSHMGEIEVRGPRALEVVRELAVNDAGRLVDGQVQYSLLCLPSGGVVDDVTVHRLAADRFLFCVNASNAAKDFTWMRERAGGRAEVIDRSAELALLALQGPRAQEILAACTSLDLASLKGFRFLEGEVAGVRCLVARTGYTGEDGFELYTPSSGAVRLWQGLMEGGGSFGLEPAGLGARDTLRLERALPLYGHELDETTTPLEAGLAWVVKLDHEFVGRAPLARQHDEGVSRRLVGVALLASGVPRQGYALVAGGERVGVVTSGTLSPTLGKPIALGYVGVAHAAVGARLEVEIRSRGVAAEIVPTPFYRRR